MSTLQQICLGVVSACALVVIVCTVVNIVSLSRIAGSVARRKRKP